MSYWEDLLGFGKGSTPRDSVSENDSLDAFRYATATRTPMGKSDLLDELRRIQAQRRQRQDQQQYEYQRAQAEMAEQMQQRQYQQMQSAFGMGQMESGAAATLADLQAAQQSALAGLGITMVATGTAPQVAAPPRKVEPAKPAKKTVDLVEPGQRKIETDE